MQRTFQLLKGLDRIARSCSKDSGVSGILFYWQWPDAKTGVGILTDVIKHWPIAILPLASSNNPAKESKRIPTTKRSPIDPFFFCVCVYLCACVDLCFFPLSTGINLLSSMTIKAWSIHHEWSWRIPVPTSRARALKPQRPNNETNKWKYGWIPLLAWRHGDQGLAPRFKNARWIGPSWIRIVSVCKTK